MKSRYVLAPEAALDLVQIWRYIKKNASLEMAERVESCHSREGSLFGGTARRRSLAQGFN